MRRKKIVCTEHFEGHVSRQEAYLVLNAQVVALGGLPDPDTFRYEREVEYIDSISLAGPSLSIEYTRASLESFGE